MDKIAHYQTLIKQALSAYAQLLEKSQPDRAFDVALVFDDQHHHYVLRELGWTDDERIRQTRLHLTVKNAKIWIEEDWTEDGIATYLLEQGVPRQDIVLGFQPPQMRPYTEFAVA
jgi:hypothetical protein